MPGDSKRQNKKRKRSEDLKDCVGRLFDMTGERIAFVSRQNNKHITIEGQEIQISLAADDSENLVLSTLPKHDNLKEVAEFVQLNHMNELVMRKRDVEDIKKDIEIEMKNVENSEGERDGNTLVELLGIKGSALKMGKKKGNSEVAGFF